MKEKVCSICGDTFYPTNANQKYCMKKIMKTCAICGKTFESTCTKHPQGNSGDTCGDADCRKKYAHMKSIAYYENNSTLKTCILCGKQFIPINNTQKVCKNVHYTSCIVCGTKYEITDVSVYLQGEYRKTCSDECFRILKHQQNTEIMKCPQTIAKIQSSRKERIDEIMEKGRKTMIEKYGRPYAYQIPEFKAKATKNAKYSKFEQRVADIFDTYDIEYIHHYFLSDDTYSHEFDFYVPKYKLLVDCDGVYYHSYLSDPDGVHVIDDYDEVRIHLVPKDHIFHVIIEGQEEKDIKELTKIMKSIDENIFDYDSYLFQWCRSIGFPYPQYEFSRMSSDFSRLYQYENHRYVKECKYGMSLIQHYHHSIYDCHVGDYPTPIEAWNDDTLMKKVITNRLIYVNEVDPSKILRGFNVSKLCPRVSIFNPVLAKYIVQKYLSEYREVFDPFSGFSGRMIGTCASGKHFIGQDLNKKAVEESNEIIHDFNLSAEVTMQDVLHSEGQYECLLTCPPYDRKETYASETVFMSCDDWVTNCLTRFKCNKYVFVIDKTEKFESYIVEEIKTSSHYNTISEYIVVI